MITTKSRKLIGPVHTVESDFAVLETEDGQTVEVRNSPPDFERYDRAGRLLEEISAGRMLVDQVYRDVYVYDSDGILIEHQEYEEENVFLGKEVFEYRADGFRISKDYYLGDNNELILASQKLFDTANELVEETHFDEDGAPLPKRPEYPRTKVIFTELDEFTTEERRFAPDGTPGIVVLESTDANGNLKEFSCFEPDGTLYLKKEYEYDFDPVGNWILGRSYHWVTGWGEFKMHPYTVTRRKITYY